jgi:CubicO group peptidase (beta-lactamase class C family)
MPRLSAPLRLVRQIASAVLVIPFALPALASTAPADPAARRAALAVFAEAELAKAYPAGGPGAAVLVRWGGETVLRKGYGMADLDLGVPIAPEHVFEIGSITKQFTAAAILELAEAGKLALEDPITRFLPDFTTGASTVTLEQLLHHTSGVPSYTEMPEWVPRWREDMSLDTLIGLFRGKPLDFPPGTSWSYSNSGYVLLGAVIEKASGKSYEEYVESELFAPLGLTATRYGHQQEIVKGRVEGYHTGNSGLENAPYLSLTQPYAAGSLMSTVDDLARWSDALEKGEVVSRASLERMFRPAVLAGGDQDGVSTRYGLGIGVHEVAGRPAHEHGGGIHGFASDLLRIPGEELVVVILSNHPESSPSALARRIAAHALGGDAAVPAAITVPEKRLDEYVGVYEVPEKGGDRRVVTREGTTLRLQRTGGSLFPLRAVGPDRFVLEERDSRVEFERDAKGKISALRIDGGFGPVFRSKRTGEPIPAERKAVAAEPAGYSAYAGVYVLAPGFEITVTAEGQGLFAQATGQGKFEVFPEGNDRFFYKVVDAQLEFVRDAAGAITSLVLHQGGQHLPAPKR